MNRPTQHVSSIPADKIQQRLASYACALKFDAIPAAAVRAAKMRIIDTFGALVGGFYDEPSRLSRDVVAEVAVAAGATVIGTRMKTTPDLAAFANATTARSVEGNDVAHKAGGRNGHPSDVVMPLLAVAENARVSGREFITAVVLAYEVYLRLAEAISSPAFDLTNFGCVANAVGAARLWGLSQDQLAQSVSIAAVASNALTQSRTVPLSMWKAAASGAAGRAGVFAAILARKGMEGAHLPFEGKNGWCKHVAQKELSFDIMGGNAVSFKVQDSIIKPRAACFLTLPAILAAEKLSGALGRRIQNVQHVTVETYGQARNNCGIDEHWWNPDSRDTADHSIPYVVAVTLKDGTVTPHSFDDSHLWDPEIRALLPKIEVVESKEFSAQYDLWPVRHRTRVSVVTTSNERLVGEAGGEHGDLSDEWSDAQIDAKFRGFTEDFLGSTRAESILECLWDLEQVQDMATIPPQFIFT